MKTWKGGTLVVKRAFLIYTPAVLHCTHNSPDICHVNKPKRK